MTQKAFYFDASACTGCKACMAACKDKNDLPIGVNWRRVVEYGGGTWVPYALDSTVMVANNVYSYAVSIGCNHCMDALCADVCPAGAITKDSDGIVQIDEEQCIGCRYCEWSCPYGGPQFHEEMGVMTKCDACADLTAMGENPACVDACVMRALEFGELNDLQARHGDVAAIEPLPSASVTKPSLVITPHRHSAMSGQGTGRIIGPVEK